MRLPENDALMTREARDFSVSSIQKWEDFTGLQSINGELFWMGKWHEISRFSLPSFSISPFSLFRIPIPLGSRGKQFLNFLPDPTQNSSFLGQIISRCEANTNSSILIYKALHSGNGLLTYGKVKYLSNSERLLRLCPLHWQIQNNLRQSWRTWNSYNYNNISWHESNVGRQIKKFFNVRPGNSNLQNLNATASTIGRGKQ